MIFDNALAHSAVLEPGTKARLKVLKPWIRRYVFNADASHKAGRFAVDCTDIICREAASAILRPFPNVYIEVDNHAAIRGAHDEPMNSAERIGFLWTEDGHCYVMGGNDHKAEFTPFIYEEHGKPEADLLQRFYAEDDDEKFRLTYETFKFLLMIGHVHDDLKDEVGKHYQNLTNLYEIGMVDTKLPYEVLDEYFKNSIGAYKCAMSCLFLLNDRIKQSLVHVKAGHMIVAGKRKAVAKHSVVTIDLDVPQIRKVYTDHIGHHDTPIEHEVGEHWTHTGCSSQCSHIWVEFQSEEGNRRDKKYGHPKPLLRETCTLCGGRRTRKPMFVSGDASKGSNIGKKKYKVIASKEKDIIKKLKEKPDGK